MRIAVFGATGYSGGNIAREALARGHEVVGVTRGDEPADAGGITWVRGTVFDPEVVAKVLLDSDVVVLAVPALGGGVPLAEVVADLMAAAAAQGVRVGVVGGAGSLRVTEGGDRLFDSPDLPAAYRPGSLAQGDVLDVLRTVPEPGDWFYLSPAGDYGKRKPGERTGTYRTGGEVLVTDAEGISYISGEDFAIAVVDEIEQPQHRRARFTVAH